MCSFHIFTKICNKRSRQQQYANVSKNYMNNTLLILSISLILSSCNSQQTSKKGNGIAQKTANPNTPYIYKNGFSDYKIVEIPVIQTTDTLTLHELRFNAVFSAMYTKKLMYEQFGMWDKMLTPNSRDYPVIVVWKKKKLFADSNKLYTVYASGVESREEMYASVMVYDENNSDCLNESSVEKEKLINYFAHGIHNLNQRSDFYILYKKEVSNFLSKRNKVKK